MSLFSGMKISGAERAPDAEGGPGRSPGPGSAGSSDHQRQDGSTGDKTKSKSHTRQEKNASSVAFGFITETTDDNSSQSGTQTVEDNVQSKFAFISATEHKTRSTPPDQKTSSLTQHSEQANNDVDFDLDLELDPLRTGCSEKSALRHGNSNTDLEGINFSGDIDPGSSEGDHNSDKSNMQEANRTSADEDVGSKFHKRGTPDHEDADQHVIASTSRVDTPAEEGNTISDARMGEECEERTCADERVAAVGGSLFAFITDSTDQDSSVKDEDLPSCHISGISSTSQQYPHEHVEEATSRTSASLLDSKEADVPSSSSLYDLELDVGDMLEVLQESQAAADQQFSDAQEALVTRLEALGRERMVAMHSLMRKQNRLDDLHALQVKAISEEDYEQAEILTVECTSLEDDLRCIPSVALHQDKAVQDILRCSRDIEDRREKQRIQWHQSYLDLLTQQEASLVRIRQERAGNSEEEMCRLEAQRAELDRKLGHVLLDKDHVLKRQAQLLTRIDEKTASLREAKLTLQNKKTAVQDDISALEEQLMNLRSMEASLSSAIDRQDDAIEATKAGFQEEVNAIEEEKNGVKVREDRLNEEQTDLDETERAVAAENQCFKSRLASEESLQSRISEALALMSSSDQQAEVMVAPQLCAGDLSGELQGSKDVVCIREQLQDATSKIQLSSALILSNQARLATSKKRVMETEDVIATLQGAKQLAVSTKSFGEAKRLAEEIKTRMVEGQAHQAEVEALADKLREDKGRVEDLQEQVERMKTELAETEKTWELGLLDNAQQLITEIGSRIGDHEPDDKSEAPASAALVGRMLAMERRVASILIGWLSDRHGVPRPHEVDRIIRECEDGIVAADTDFQSDDKETDSKPVAGVRL